MVKVLCIGESPAVQAEMLKLREAGHNILMSPSGEVAVELIKVHEESSMTPIDAIVVFDGIGDKNVSITDIECIRQSKRQTGPIIFLSPEEDHTFDFDFIKNRVIFVKTPIRTNELAEVIAMVTAK